MRIRFLWPLGIVLLALLAGPSCEDDPDDLLYLKTAGTSGGGIGAAASGATAGAPGH